MSMGKKTFSNMAPSSNALINSSGTAAMLVFSLFTLVPHAMAQECYSCASPILRSQWQATGLPQFPSKNDAGKKFDFLDHCAAKPVTGSGTNQIPKTSCSGGTCIEMLLVVNTVYSMVRGCLGDFFPPNSPAPSGNPECTFAISNQNVTLVNEKNEMVLIDKANVGVNLCQAQSTDPCNNKLMSNLDFAQGNKQETATSASDKWPFECKRPTNGNFNCLNCMRYDMNGNCDRDVRTYCPSNWCTKTVGYVNGRWMEIRGCAGFSPVNTQYCALVERDAEISLIGQTQVTQHISMEQCFCSGQYCNGAIGTKTVGMVTMAIAAALLTILAKKAI